MDLAHPAPLSMEFSRQEYWSGLPFPSPGDLLEPRIEPVSPALQTDSLPLHEQGSPWISLCYAKSLQSCPTLGDPIDGSQPGSPVPGILQARTLEWVSLYELINWHSDIFKKPTHLGFPHSSVGKESACNEGDPGSIPGSGRSAGEGIGYPLQYFGASLVAQLVKNPSAMWETWVRSLGWEDPLEKGKATHSSILAWRIQGLYSPWGRKESDTTE